MFDRRGAANGSAGEALYQWIVGALAEMGKPLDQLTVRDLAPADHFHARGLTGTVELADRLPLNPEDRLLDTGCGLGGPAGDPVYPAPQSEDGSNSFLVPPAETRDLLQAAGFVDFSSEDMRPKYLSFSTSSAWQPRACCRRWIRS